MERETIQRIVAASGVQAGELVLVHFWGEDADLPFAREFMNAVAALGASPVLLQQARTANQVLFAQLRERFSEAFFARYAQFDAVLDVFTYRPVVLGGELAPEQLELYRCYMAGLFRALMKAKRFAQIRVPTVANAAESGLAPDDYIARMNTAYAIDYDCLRRDCADAVEQLSACNTLRLFTGDGCVLSLDLTGRSWYIDAGDGDWPCGEVYIAPNEAATDGCVWFETLFIDDVGQYADVTLTVKGGRVTECNQPDVDAWLKALPEAGRIVCELGLGMNPGVVDLCGYPVLDEKMAGSFHIALGANTMFGGANDANTHIDLVGFGKLLK